VPTDVSMHKLEFTNMIVKAEDIFDIHGNSRSIHAPSNHFAQKKVKIKALVGFIKFCALGRTVYAFAI
jgi:hypothetical protein